MALLVPAPLLLLIIHVKQKSENYWQPLDGEFTPAPNPARCCPAFERLDGSGTTNAHRQHGGNPFCLSSVATRNSRADFGSTLTGPTATPLPLDSGTANISRLPLCILLSSRGGKTKLQPTLSKSNGGFL